MDWLRELAQQNLDHSKGAVEALLIATRKTGDALAQQTSVVRDRSTLLADETFSNTFDYLHKLVRIREPHELVQVQSEFISRQAQVLGDQTKKFGQTIMETATEITKTSLDRTAETVRKRAEAA